MFGEDDHGVLGGGGTHALHVVHLGLRNQMDHNDELNLFNGSVKFCHCTV